MHEQENLEYSLQKPVHIIIFRNCIMTVLYHIVWAEWFHQKIEVDINKIENLFVVITCI